MRQLQNCNGTDVGRRDSITIEVPLRLAPPRRQAGDHKKRWAKQKANLHCGEKMLQKNDARWCVETKLCSTSALSFSTSGRSQNGCLVDKTSGTSPNCLTSLTSMTANRHCLTWHSQPVYHPGGTVCSQQKPQWQELIASDDTHLTPRPPSLTGRLTCVH